MYVIFRVVETGDIECHPMAKWLVHKEGADVWTMEEDTLEYRNGQWSYLGYEVEILEMMPDIRRFLK